MPLGSHCSIMQGGPGSLHKIYPLTTLIRTSVVLVWLHIIIDLVLAKRLLKHENLVLVLVSQLKWKKGY